jgi:hypothetical protein
MLKNSAANDEKVVAAKSFIDLTIATVLGAAEDEEDDCEIIAVTQKTSPHSTKRTQRRRRNSILFPCNGERSRAEAE